MSDLKHERKWKLQTMPFLLSCRKISFEQCYLHPTADIADHTLLDVIEIRLNRMFTPTESMYHMVVKDIHFTKHLFTLTLDQYTALRNKRIGDTIQFTRYYATSEGVGYTIDEFTGRYQGLVIAAASVYYDYHDDVLGPKEDITNLQQYSHKELCCYC